MIKNFVAIDEPRIVKIEEVLLELASELKKLNKQPKSSWLSTKDAAALLQVTNRTMQNYRDEGKIPFSQVGSKIYYRESDIEDFLEIHYHEAWNESGRRA
jgi:excisionase family DNA binding protein